MNNVSNRCRCCGNDIGSDSFCKVCGMTPVSFTNLNTDLNVPAKDYIRKVLHKGSIDILCYIYCVENNKFSEPKGYYEKLCQSDLYWVGDVVYPDFKFKFESIPTSESFQVQLRVNFGGTSEEKTLTVSPKGVLDRSRIGIEFLPCFRARLVVGGENGSAYSDEFSLTAMS